MFLFTRDRAVVVDVVWPSSDHCFDEQPRTAQTACVPLSQVERLSPLEAGFGSNALDGKRIIRWWLHTPDESTEGLLP